MDHKVAELTTSTTFPRSSEKSNGVPSSRSPRMEYSSVWKSVMGPKSIISLTFDTDYSSFPKKSHSWVE